MDIEKQPEPDRTIVVRAVYTGNEPTLSQSREPFFLGKMAIIEPVTPMALQNNIPPMPFEYVEFLQGNTCIDKENFKSGVFPMTVLVIYDVPVSEAETWNEIPDWKFERLSWTKYRGIIEKKYERANQVRDSLIERLTTGWTRFFNLTIDGVTGNKVIRIDVYFGKHSRDPKFQSTDRHHYKVNVKSVRVNDLFSAVEYIEQAFFLFGVDCELKVTVDAIEVYSTPRGITNEAPKSK